MTISKVKRIPKQVRLLFGKDLRELWRQKKVLALILIYAAVVITLTNTALGSVEEEHVRIKLVVEEQTTEDVLNVTGFLETMVKRQGATVTVNYVPKPYTREDALKDFEDKFHGVFVVPRDFVETMLVNHTGVLNAYYSRSINPNMQMWVRAIYDNVMEKLNAWARKALARLATEQVQNETQGVLSSEAQKEITESIEKAASEPIKSQQQYAQPKVTGRFTATTFREDLSPTSFTLIILSTAILLISVNGVEEKDTGTFRRLTVLNVRRESFILGKAAVALIVLSLQISVILVLHLFVFDQNIFGSIALTFFVMLLLGICCVGVGLVIAALAKTRNEANTAAVLVCFFMIFLSGILWPLTLMPDWVNTLGAFLPLTYGSDALLRLMLSGEGLDSSPLKQDILVLSIMTFVLFVLASLVLRQKEG